MIRETRCAGLLRAGMLPVAVLFVCAAVLKAADSGNQNNVRASVKRILETTGVRVVANEVEMNSELHRVKKQCSRRKTGNSHVGGFEDFGPL